MARKRARVSLNDDTQMDTEPAGGADASTSGPSAGNADAGAARGHVHSVRLVGSIVGERFVVKAHLGRGRLGERYRAVDRSLSDPDLANERCVVLHFLNTRVAQQTRLLQKLETSYLQPHSWAHRNIVSVIGFGSDRGEYFFVTEELEGGTLRTILDEVAPDVPPEEETFSVLSGIGDALKYAHAKGVVHGDIRPENVFVTNDLVVKVLDLLPATLPRTVPVFPEDNAASGPSIPHPRDDVYGLACVAYELFAGKHPFNFNTALEALAAGLRPAPILSLDPRSWSALVGGLALRREQRTASVAAFLADLGVTGRERLRRASEAERAATANAAVAASAAAAAAAARGEDADWSDLSDRTLTTVGARAPSARPPSASAPIVDHPYEPLKIRFVERPRRANRWLPWVAALAIGAGVVYWNYPWLQQQGPEWLAIGRAMVDKVAESRGATAPRVASEPTPPKPTQPSSTLAEPTPRPADAAAAPASPRAANVAPASPAPQPGVGAASSVAAPAPRDASPPPQDSRPQTRDASPPANDARQPPAATLPSAQPPAQTDASSSPATQVKRAAIAGEPAATEIFEPEKLVVVVSEAAPSAAVTIRRRGNVDASSSFVWWTSDGTAVADEDYLNLGARIEKLAAGEQTRTIYIPIVHDSKHEDRESFYVNVRPAQGGKRLDPAERVEVVIEDDD
jgi:serine/threonine protein kinase